MADDTARNLRDLTRAVKELDTTMKGFSKAIENLGKEVAATTKLRVEEAQRRDAIRQRNEEAFRKAEESHYGPYGNGPLPHEG